MHTVVRIQPLTKAAFAKFGDVIECEESEFFPINDGHTQRYHALSTIQCEGEGSSVGITIFRNVITTDLPLKISMLERHPYGSQSFIPMARQKFLIIVALASNADQPDEQHIYAFESNGLQGVTYAKGVWHHPLLSYESPSDFLVVDRISGGENCDVYQLSSPCVINY
ncbi:ureidoglycolate lyase [Acinetobacter qingfengensis]|uniref:Ureidoglycolate hydrolase n=1 Tax=Acinetobacter qingfengensis TaxID=1262585 RepID=A0A1E7R903_9GAMM|nr:ureidoglycolate lyase [Acinetobacter qingfengensis]KAA8735406.1 ureidoglycolate lyase [Acinetobacter qingfengensis]OEY95765.1 ureidoglycolate hydrolase [Acinetobacter qingfengensis]